MHKVYRLVYILQVMLYDIGYFDKSRSHIPRIKLVFKLSNYDFPIFFRDFVITLFQRKRPLKTWNTNLNLSNS